MLIDERVERLVVLLILIFKLLDVLIALSDVIKLSEIFMLN